MSNRRPRWPVAVAAATGCFLLAACSSKSTTKPPAAAASAAATQAATATAPTAATGSPTPPGAPGGNPHACSLVTEQEASTALGADPGPGQETSSAVPGVGNCVYGRLVGPGVRVSVDTSGVGKAIYEGARSSYPSSQVTDVPHVGDGAFEIVTSDSQVTVYLYKGGTSASITLTTAATTGPPKDQGIALAKTAADRI
jgi:hypothetical protein